MTERRARLTLDLDSSLHSRLKIVCARKGTTMRSYAEEALEQRLVKEPVDYLTAEEAPVLDELWNNSDDDAYDAL